MSDSQTTQTSSTETSSSKFLQIGKVVKIKRSQIVEDELNPRHISEANAKRLKNSIKKNGLVGHLVWNKHTGHIVGGHQRLQAIDQLQRKDEYDLEVLMVDIPLKDEVRMNVVLNNTDNQGYFDFGLLQKLSDEYQLDVMDDFGFSEEVVNIEFPDVQEVIESEAGEAPEIRTASEEDIALMKERKKEGRERFKDNQEEFGNWRTDAKGVVTVVFEKESEKREWLKGHGLDENANVLHIYDIETALLGSIQESSNPNSEKQD